MNEDKSILHFIAMSYKMGKPYLQYAADMFNRERIDNIDEKDYRIANWTQTNLHCNELRHLKLKLKIGKDGKEATPLEGLEGGLKSYFHRVHPKLQLKPLNFIVDSLQEVSEWIAGTIAFVHGLASSSVGPTCPFQFDASMIPLLCVV